MFKFISNRVRAEINLFQIKLKNSLKFSINTFGQQI